MKPYVTSLINSLVLIVLGLWAFFSSETPSFTALIPVFIGTVLLALNPGLKKENKIIAHVVVVLTFVVLVGLLKPLTGAFAKSNFVGIIRVVLMIVTTIIALVSFVQSFKAARQNK